MKSSTYKSNLKYSLKLSNTSSFQHHISEVLNVHKATDYVSENLEHAFKKSRFHNDIQNLAKDTRVTFPANNVTYVYVHVPRTGGDSMGAHLYPASEDVVHTGSAWWGDPGVPNLELTVNDPTKSKVVNFKRLYKGFWSRDRLLSIIKNATKHHSGTAFDMKRHKIKLFTILRHPQERVCSAYKFLNIYGHTACAADKKQSGKLIDFLRRALKKNPAKIQKSDPCPYTGRDWKYRTFMNNGMTYQLGNILEAQERTLDPEIAVKNAKEFLDMMDFIGFYEDWNVDFHRLKATIFPDLDVNGMSWKSWFRQEIFTLGTYAARNRMRTKKYSGHVKGEAKTLLELATKYDMQVYKYARRRLGRPEDGGLHKTYNHWMLKEVLPYGMLATVILFLCCNITKRLCRACLFFSWVKSSGAFLKG